MNPAAGVLVLLVALYLLLAFLSGKLEWLFAAVSNPAAAVSGDVGGPGDVPGDNGGAPGEPIDRPRPTTTRAT